MSEEKLDYEAMWRRLREFVRGQQVHSEDTAFDRGWRQGARAIELQMLEDEVKAKGAE